MKKHSLLFFAIAALTACGGEDKPTTSSSSTQSSEVTGISSSSAALTPSSASVSSEAVNSSSSIPSVSSASNSSQNNMASTCDESELIAFPCAEGYGKKSVGGRGGDVYIVTNLNSSGAGSFGEAVSASGPRTVVFAVGGVIKGNFSIKNDKITIAGQTAPGDGIAINGTLRIDANDVILRYLRVRGNANGDVISNNKGSPKSRIILDHISTSWSSDEVLSIYFDNDVTIQWTMITEAGSASHKFGGIWGNHRSTYHHNLFAHNTDRNPRIASGAGSNDVRNNVMYNWKNESLYGCEMQQVGSPQHNRCSTNVVANYYKPGPGTPTTTERHTRIASPWSRNGAADYGDWYISDNYLVGHPEVTADNWKGVFPQYTGNIANDQDAKAGLRLNTPAEHMPIRPQTAEEAYLSVLEHVGASLPKRDRVDARIIEEVRTGTFTYGDNGFISKPSDVGGHPDLQNGAAPEDSDKDGMPNEWELTNGLDPFDPSDRNNTYGPGFTMLEKYLNSIDSF